MQSQILPSVEIAGCFSRMVPMPVFGVDLICCDLEGSWDDLGFPQQSPAQAVSEYQPPGDHDAPLQLLLNERFLQMSAGLARSLTVTPSSRN